MLDISSFFSAINRKFDHLLSSSQRGVVIGFVAIAFLLISPLDGVDRLHVPALGMVLRVPITSIEQIGVVIDDLFDLITVIDYRLEVCFIFCHIESYLTAASLEVLIQEVSSLLSNCFFKRISK